MEDETMQPIINQEPTQPNNPPAQPKQEEQPKKEKEKMSDVDLSKCSLEELQAAIEKKKQEEANKAPETIESLNAQLEAEQDPQKKIEIVEKMKKLLEEKAKIQIPEPKQGDLVKWVYSHEGLALGQLLNRDIIGRIAADFPGDLKPFITLLDDSKNPTTEKEKVNYIRFWDVDIEHKTVIDETVISCGDYNTFRYLISRLFPDK